MTEKEFIDKLKHDLVVEVNIPPKLQRVIGNASPWKEFCALPAPVKDEFASTEPSGGNPTYVSRTSTERLCIGEYLHACNEEDKNKVFFNSRSELKERYPEIERLQAYVKEVNEVAIPFLLSCGEYIAKHVPTLKEILDTNKYRVLTRYLHYLPLESQEIITQHYDRGLYAIHLYEDSPGDQYLSPGKNWNDVRGVRSKSFFFCGNQMELISNRDLQKVWHRVLNPSTRTGRFSIVMFLWSDELPQRRGIQEEGTHYN